MIKRFLLALQFLTILPVKCPAPTQSDLANSLIYFPFVGLLLGFISSGADNFLIMLGAGQLTAAVVTIALLTAITGAIHLDGLADTFDGLGSGRCGEEALRIMRDPCIGTFGVVALIMALMLKVALLNAIFAPSRLAALCLMCLVSRSAQVYLVSSFGYARTQGKALAYIQGMTKRIGLFSAVLAFLLSAAIGQLMGVVILGLVLLAAYSAGRYFQRRLGGITGDTIGAVSEFSEVLVLLIAVLWERGWLWTV